MDEYHRLKTKDPDKDSAALELIVGKEWANVPTSRLMELVSTRLSVKPKDYAYEEVEKVVGLLVELGHNMSPEQRKFITKFDHLPLSLNTEQPWMQGDELMAYEKSADDAIYERKTQSFLVSNGIMLAVAQARGEQVSPKQEKKPFKVHPAVVVIVLVILGVIVFSL